MAKTIKDEEWDAEFGRRTRLRREFLGLTMAELAARVRVTYGQIVSLEAGEVAVRASALEMIADAQEVPLSYFYRAQDQGFPSASFPPEALECARRLNDVGDKDAQSDLLLLINHLATRGTRVNLQRFHQELGENASEGN